MNGRIGERGHVMSCVVTVCTQYTHGHIALVTVELDLFVAMVAATRRRHVVNVDHRVAAGYLATIEKQNTVNGTARLRGACYFIPTFFNWRCFVTWVQDI